MATLKQIEKKSSDIYLATDDGSLIYDEGDDTYLVIKLGDALKQIAKNILNTRTFKILETQYAQYFRLQEDGSRKITEASGDPSINKITKNVSTLKKINKS